MQEIISRRTESSKTYDLGGRRRALDAHIGAIHYKDNYADDKEHWKDIDLTWEGNRITKAPYELTLDGQKITVGDKKTGDISVIELLDCKPEGLKWQVIPENTRVRFQHILPSDKIPFEARFKVTGKIPLLTRAWDDKGEISLETSFLDGILTERLSDIRDAKTGEKRQAVGIIRIDPTIDVQVSADADDGCIFRYDSGLHRVSAGKAADYSLDAWIRWTGVTVAGTIDVSYIQLYHQFTNGTPRTRIYGVDEDNPNAPTSAAEYDADPKTSAFVDWDGAFSGTWNQSPSLNTIFQELIDSYTIENDAIMLQWRDDNSPSGDNYNDPYDYGEDSTKAAKLHIEYTVAGPQIIEGTGIGSGIGLGSSLGQIIIPAPILFGQQVNNIIRLNW